MHFDLADYLLICICRGMNEKTIKLSSNTIDITPTWRASVEIMLAVLSNPKASKESKQVCHEELLKLADIVDRIKSNNQ